MKILHRFFYISILIQSSALAQTYTSYLTGPGSDTLTQPFGGVCLMGGATEDDNAMKWFLQRANGGDVLVLRASGSNGYNDYLYSQLGIPVHSVETIVCTQAGAAYDPYVQQRIAQAEAIWFAGGNQWNYISYWRNTPVDSLLNIAINQRHIVIGGTSAGMAIQGQAYFSAQNGTAASATALANPFDNTVTPDTAGFLNNLWLTHTITDTHFDNPDRRGRLVVFLARLLNMEMTEPKAIACDEYTAVCIDTLGMAKVFGQYPTSDDNAYFIQLNCDINAAGPETCMAGSALTWYRDGQALRVYQVKGTPLGGNSFSLSDWESGQGGTWLFWSANGGTFSSQTGIPPNCDVQGLPQPIYESLLYPNPTYDWAIWKFKEVGKPLSVSAVNILGQVQNLTWTMLSDKEIRLNLTDLSAGFYQLRLITTNGKVQSQKIKIE
jgi:cyanophycinase-like exopeptidase